MVGLIPLFAVDRHRAEAARARAAASWSALRAVPREPSRSCSRHPPDRPGRSGTATAACCAVVDRERLRRILARCSTRTSSSRPYGIRSLSRVPPRAPVRLPRRAARSTASTTSRPSPTPACSAATRTGAARSGCRSTTCSSERCCSSTRYYGDDVQGRVPDRLGPADEPVRGGAASSPTRLTRIFLRDARRPPAGVRRRREKFQTDPHWRDHRAVLRVLPRRQRRRARRQPPDRLDGLVAELDPAVRPRRRRPVPRARKAGGLLRRGNPAMRQSGASWAPRKTFDGPCKVYPRFSLSIGSDRRRERGEMMRGWEPFGFDSRGGSHGEGHSDRGPGRRRTSPGIDLDRPKKPLEAERPGRSRPRARRAARRARDAGRHRQTSSCRTSPSSRPRATSARAGAG